MVEAQDDLTQYYEDLTIENDEETQPSKKQSPARKGFYTSYTHFITIPILGEEIKEKIVSLNKEILSHIEEPYKSCIKFDTPECFHISLAMLTLPKEGLNKDAIEAFAKAEEDIKALLKDQPFKIKLGGFEAITEKMHSKNSLPKLLYISLVKEANIEQIDKITNCVIRALMEKEVIDADSLPAMNVFYDHTTSMFKPSIYHATFMKVKNTPEKKYDATSLIEKTKEHQLGEYTVKRLDISTRLQFGEDKFYKSLASMKL
jgi:hypothetical protein